MKRGGNMAKGEKLRVVVNGEVDLSLMSESQKNTLYACTIAAIERFYADPTNMAAYREWAAQQAQTEAV